MRGGWRPIVDPGQMCAILIRMIESQLIGKHLSQFISVLGYPVIVPDRPPENDPEFGLDRYIELPDQGVCILIDWNDICSCVQFFGEKNSAHYEEYTGHLPFNLSFSSSRFAVREAMGDPVASNDRTFMDYPLTVYPWDWFNHEGRKVHFQYNATLDSVSQVTVMPLPQHC